MNLPQGELINSRRDYFDDIKALNGLMEGFYKQVTWVIQSKYLGKFIQVVPSMMKELEDIYHNVIGSSKDLVSSLSTELDNKVFNFNCKRSSKT